MGCALVVLVYIFATMSIFIPIVAVFMNVDPTYFIFKVYIPPEITSGAEIQILIVVIRLVLSCVGGFELFRLGPITVIFLIVLTRIVIDSIVLLRKSDDLQEFIKFYNIVSIWHCVIPNITNFAMMLLLGCCSILLVTLNFGTFRGYGIIPIPLYLVFPSLFVVLYSLVWYVLTRVIKIHEDTENQLYDRKSKLVFNYKGRRTRKYFQLKINSMHPVYHEVGFNGFSLFKIKKSTRTTYYNVITNYTITALLSVPLE